MEPLAPGSLLADRYRLGGRVGAGGMSVVWRAHDQVLDRTVAIKVLIDRRDGNHDRFRARVRAEARSAARLSHPNVVNVYDYAETTGPDGTVLPFVVMELVDGQTLAARLAGGPLPWRQAVRIAADVADALAVAHAQGVVHRDITAGNVLLTRSGPKVVDFGISAMVGSPDSEPDSGGVFGTPEYVAPERMLGLPVGPESDVYSLGVLLHLMLTGTPPFTGPSTTAVTRAHWYTPPAPLPAIAGLPPEVDRIRRHCLAKRVGDRPTAADASAQLAALAGVTGHEQPTSPGLVSTPPGPGHTRAMPTRLMPPTGVPRTAEHPARAVARWATRPGRRRTVLAATAAVLLVGLAGLIGFGLYDGPGAHPATGHAAPPATHSAAPTTPPPSPTGAGGCQVRWVSADWQLGFTVQMWISSDRDLHGWTLRFTFPGDQKVTNGWNGKFDQQGGTVTVTNEDWNADTTAGQLTIGFNGSSTGDNGKPTAVTLNGTACTVS